MKLTDAFKTTTAFAFMLSVAGVPGLAQSQIVYDDYDLHPYYEYDPYYAPYLNNGYGYEAGDYDPFDYIQTDSELRARIKLDLAMSPFVDEDNVYISVNSGIVTLSGTVEDRSAMVDAVEIAYDAGAWKVRNKLDQRERENRPWADMRDWELEEAIEDELALSPFVNSDQISVSVRDGVATLYGGVENKGEIADAVENAYEAGAKRVKSLLWVDPDVS